MNSRSLSLVVLIAVIVVGGTFLWSQLSSSSNKVGYGDVSVQQALDLIKAKPDLFILDVRTSQEYSEGHLKGAVLIPVDELATRLGELSKAKEILVYCRTGNRSRTAVNLLAAEGYQKLFHMKEGITVWTIQGYSIEK